MKRHDLSRKHFISLGVLGSLGLLRCSSDDDAGSNMTTGSTGQSTSTGQGGTAGPTSSTMSTTTSTGGSGGGSTTTAGGSSGGTGGSGTGGGAGGSSGGNGGTGGTGAGGKGGSAGSGGTGGQGGNGGSAGGSGGKGGSAGSGGSTGGKGGSAGSGGTGGNGGSKDGGTSVDAGACTMDPVANISMNHMMQTSGPHYLKIPAADIAAGVEKVYQTSSTPGASGAGPIYPQSHEHFVKVTAADFAMLRSGMIVRKKSCDANHMHEFALRCGTAPTAGTPTCGAADNQCGGMANPCP